MHESEKYTRDKRIDPRLKRLGWHVIPYEVGLNTSSLQCHAVGEYPTSNGPADYAMFVNGKLLGILEAKKYAVASQNVLEQAKRYAKGVIHNIGSWNGYMVPFLYATNGEHIFHLDTRDEKNIARQIEDFHTPEAMWEFFNRNIPASYNWLLEHDITNMNRPYQKNAVLDVESAIMNGKRKMMVAMATGTGKTYTSVYMICRLLKSHSAKRILFLVERPLYCRTCRNIPVNALKV